MEEIKDYLVYVQINGSIRLYGVKEQYTIREAVDVIDTIANKIFKKLEDKGIDSECELCNDYYDITYKSDDISINLEIGIINVHDINKLDDELTDEFLFPNKDLDLPFFN